MDKNESEKRRLQDYVIDNLAGEKYTFPVIDNSLDSYYICRNESEKYIREYGFDTATDIKKELDLLWDKDKKMEKLIKIVMVAALKNKPDFDKTQHIEYSSNVRGDENLPTYIYNF